MAYPASSDLTPRPAVVEEGSDLGYRDVDVWTVNTHIHPDNHACTSLTRITGANRQVVVEKRECYQVPARSRMQALLTLKSAIESAIVDETGWSLPD